MNMTIDMEYEYQQIKKQYGTLAKSQHALVVADGESREVLVLLNKIEDLEKELKDVLATKVA